MDGLWKCSPGAFRIFTFSTPYKVSRGKSSRQCLLAWCVAKVVQRNWSEVRLKIGLCKLGSLAPGSAKILRPWHFRGAGSANCSARLMPLEDTLQRKAASDTKRICPNNMPRASGGGGGSTKDGPLLLGLDFLRAWKIGHGRFPWGEFGMRKICPMSSHQFRPRIRHRPVESTFWNANHTFQKSNQPKSH